ncbi:MAG TPA: heme o synthase [Actinomycetes bacterium]|nr:heme o synthase [Actinomycetes bacterium]
MTRFQRLAVATTVATFVLIGVGGLVRATDSGLGCPDWPACFGRLVPPPELHAWVEHSHRLVASVVLGMVALLAVAAWRTRQDRAVRRAAAAAAVLVAWQALLGAIVVWARLQAESVTLHLATALALVGLLLFVTVRSRTGRPGAGRSRLAAAAAAAAAVTYLQMLVGSTVTGADAGLAFADFPLMGGRLLPRPDGFAQQLQLAHRALALLVALAVVATWVQARRVRATRPRLALLAATACALVAVQIALGALNVWWRLSALSVVPHLLVGALLWGALVTLALAARTPAGDAAPGRGGRRAARGRVRQTVGAYLLLTKPRIIELLLVTTVPAMFLAARGLPSGWLVLATLVGGTLSAASANTINCYLDRDIDQVMRRTARRPLPRHQVAPASALRFGLVLGLAGFAWLWATVNLLSALLATGAIGFYVFVYTLGLKRRSTQNIVIGGAAGAVPVLVGWAAVTGTIQVPALVLFAIVFYWTPAHFWALSMRYAEDYRSAGVPMLPVVHGQRETSHQILFYTLLVVAVTLLLFPAGRMGLIYLTAAVGLGAAFVWRAARLCRHTSGARAVRLFAFSNLYLLLLFAAMALDTIVPVRV